MTRAAAVAVAAFLALGAGAAGAARLDFTLPEARGVARQAFRTGDYRLANALGETLARADRDDPAALILLAATDPLFGRATRAQAAGARAWRITKAPGLRHEAAFYTARASLFQRRFGAAKRWLRRAHGVAATEAQRNRAARAYRRVRAAAPWRVRLRASLAPRSNLNGGSETDLLVIDDIYAVGRLSGAAQALSGWRASIGGDFEYRVARGTTHQTVLGLRGYHSFNRLSAKARQRAPAAEGPDFDYAVAEAAVVHRRSAPRGALPDTYRLALGQTWYGGAAYERYLRLGAGRSVRLGRGFALRLSAAARQGWSRTDRADTLGLRARAAVSRRFGRGHRVRLSVERRRVMATAGNQDFAGWRAELGLALGQPVGPVALSGSLGYRVNDYADYSVGFLRIADGRSDREVTAKVAMRLVEPQVLGFSPVVTVRGRRATSNISRFERESVGVSIGVKSAF